MESSYSKIADAMAVVSVEEQCFVECNDATLTLFGYPTREDFFRKKPWELSPDYQPDGENSRAKGLRHMMLALETGSHYFDWLHTRKDGTEIYCMVMLTRIIRDGKPYIQTTCRDITPEKTALRKLESQQHEMNQIMNALNQTALVCWTDASGRILDVNDYYLARCGYAREELIGATHDLLVPIERDPAVRENIMKMLGSGKLWTGVLNNQAKDGSIYWVNTVITPIRDSNGTIMKFMSIQTDLTELTETQSKLNHAQEVAQMGSWEFHVEKNEMYGSVNLFKLYQLPANVGRFEMQDAITSRIHKDDLPMVFEAMGKSLRTGEDYSIRHRLVFDDGSIKYVDCRANIMKGRTGTRMLGTSSDVTEAVLREEHMKEVLDFNGAVMDSADCILMTVDTNGILTGMNENAIKMLGYKPEELVGLANVGIVHLPEELMKVTLELNAEFGLNLTEPGMETFTYRARRGLKDSRQWTLVRKDGTTFQSRLSITPLRDSKGVIYGYVGIARDLTEEITIRDALEIEKAKSLHNAKLASLGEMAAGVAHEINNPLAMIAGSAELLMISREDETKFAKKIEIIRRASSRIEKIVRGLQKFARTTGSNEFGNADLRTIVQDSLILVDSKARRHNVKIAFEATGDSSIYCDAVEIEQVVVNLINNGIDAIKHLPERWVKIEVRPSNVGVLLQVTDAGSGIPLEIESKLFQPFFTTKPVGEGTGLGLSIVKGILDQHKASIRVNRNLKHTCFELEFPTAQSPKPEATRHGA